MREDLQRRVDEISQQIRHYPTPIARCDLHLPALIEERTALLARLRELEMQGPCSPETIWANDGGAVH